MKCRVRSDGRVREKEMQPIVQKLTLPFHTLLTSIQGKIKEIAEFPFFFFLNHSFKTHLFWFVSGRGREESRQIFTAPFHNWVTTQKQSYF